MNPLKIFLVALFGYFLATAFQKSSSAPKSATFQEAVQQKLVNYSLVSNGGHDKSSVQLTISNLGSSPLEIRLPNGTVFVPSEVDDQDLLLVEDEILVLQAKEKKEIILDAYCMESSDGSPEKGGKMTYRNLKEGDPLKKLCTQINGQTNSSLDIQSAVWAVSDNQPIEYLSLDNPASRQLRNNVCTITGRPNTWYSLEAQRQMTPERRIATSSTRLNGHLSVPVTKKAVIQTKVLGTAGEIKIALKEQNFDKAGTWEYGFKLFVKGWEKGEYSVVVYQDGAVLKVFPFSV